MPPHVSEVCSACVTLRTWNGCVPGVTGAPQCVQVAVTPVSCTGLSALSVHTPLPSCAVDRDAQRLCPRAHAHTRPDEETTWKCPCASRCVGELTGCVPGVKGAAMRAMVCVPSVLGSTPCYRGAQRLCPRASEGKLTACVPGPD